MAVGTDITHPSSSLIDWARSNATTMRKHLRDVEQAMLRKRMLTALVERNGGVEHNVSGNGFDWPVQYKIHDAEANDGTTTRNFAPTNLWKTANLQFGGLQVTDSIRQGELLANRGKEAIVNVPAKMTERMKKSLMERFAPSFYDDGATTSETIYGFNSFLGVLATANVDQAYDWGTAGATPSNTAENNAVGDPIMVPDDVYAGLTTDLGNYGGAQESGGWPEGKASAEFDFFTPLIINTNSTFFGDITSGTGWQDNAVEAVRFGLLHANRNSVDDEIDLILMDRTLLYQLRNLLDAKERVIVSRNDGVRSYGFKNVFEIDGVECSTEYGIPTRTINRSGASDTVVRGAYGFSSKNIEIKNRFGQLFHVDQGSGQYDIHTQAFLYCVDMQCQLKFRSPRNFIYWAGFSATS